MHIFPRTPAAFVVLYCPQDRQLCEETFPVCNLSFEGGISEPSNLHQTRADHKARGSKRKREKEETSLLGRVPYCRGAEPGYLPST